MSSAVMAGAADAGDKKPDAAAENLAIHLWAHGLDDRGAVPRGEQEVRQRASQ